MKNTGIEFMSGERELSVLPEMAELLPPLSEEQLLVLEQDILTNGCYSPVIVNEDLVIVDGHNRHSVCEKHGLPYRVVVFSFVDLLEAKQWALDTQKSRRNLEKWELGKIALKLKPEFEAKGLAKMSVGGKNKTNDQGFATLQNLKPEDDTINTHKELADAVGIGQRTMSKVLKIDELAPDVVKEALDNKDISINKAYGITQHLKDFPEDQREEVAAILLSSKKADDDAEDFARTAKSFCTAFEKGNLLKVSEENVHIWIDFAGIRTDMIDDMVQNARQIADKFITLANILEKL